MNFALTRWMHRSTRWLAVAIGLLMVAKTENSQVFAQQASPPNIVFIMADDLGWADVAFHGGNTPTPNLDGLVRNGVELEQHYVAPVCSPTRTGLMTGRCWSRFGITTPSNVRCLPWETLTLPSALKSVGYETCITGKWHLGSRPEEGPNHFGFEHSYGSLAGGVSPWNHRYKKGPFTETWHRNEKLIEETGHVTDLITQEAVRWIGDRSDKPFFLYVPFTAVHLPIKEPEAWVERVPAEITGDVARHYSACVMHLDDSVGKIVAALEAKGVRDKTIVVFTSDNGGSTAENNDLLYPDDQCPNGRLVGNNRPFRKEKGSVYEGGTRVATIVSWPGRLSPRKVSVPVQITDWMPTFCSLAGARPAIDPKWDGTDISSLLLNGSNLPDRALYTVGPSWNARALRLGDWKLVVMEEGKSRKAELYHINNDPSETTDLATREPAKLAELLAQLEKMSQRDRDSAVKR